MLPLFCLIQPLSNAGRIVPAGTLTFYATGTVIEKDVYADADGDTVLENPVELDANGRAFIFLDIDGAYDIVFKDADGVTLWTITKFIAPEPAL